MLAIERLSYQDAMILIEGAEKKAQEISVPMCIAITDESGFLIAFKRMDGGKPLSTTLAQDKAHTAAISRKSTQAYNDICQPGNLSFGIHTSAAGRFSTVGGGIPIELNGAVVGAIGISGGIPQQDISCCEAGISNFLKTQS